MKIVMVNGAAVLIGSESPPFAARGGVQCQGLIKQQLTLSERSSKPYPVYINVLCLPPSPRQRRTIDLWLFLCEYGYWCVLCLEIQRKRFLQGVEESK